MYSAATPRSSRPLRRVRRFTSSSRGAAALYAVVALAWIATSDLIVSALGIDTPWINIGKGYLFVITTTLLLFSAFRRHEDEVAEMIADLEHTARERNAALEGTTRAVGAMIEARDPYTAGHQQRVGDLAARIGAALGFDPDRVEGLRIGGYLHDVGKIAIAPEVLSRPGPLDRDEYLLVKEHSRRGHEILAPVPFQWPVAEIARQHHERIDGSGYPAGLRGEEIVLEARIVAVADTYDAIVSARPYRPGSSSAAALEVIDHGEGTLFDAEVVQALRTLLTEDGGLRPTA